MPKDESVASDLIVALQASGPVTGNGMEEIRNQLGFENIPMTVFQSTVWHMLNDDRANAPIRMKKPHYKERRLAGKRPVTLEIAPGS